ncbi:hypothetical protein EB796_002308 [Bugula neritina]|uniref:Uncharacterized protein n=1 Tax=Bugula neritina TaxID=10212 RepID=A0A7J7KMK4_BUGNE|nr:hypothetical protein EB796_002308 [Bugula neritina]
MYTGTLTNVAYFFLFIISKLHEDKLKKAARMIAGEESSIRHTAETYGVDKMTLKSYFDKQKLGYEITSAAKRVFTTEEEKLVVDHILEF